MLRSGEVHVWRLLLGPLGPNEPSLLARWRQTLSAEELRRADRLRGDSHRQDFIRAHAALRLVLGQCLGILPSEVPLANDPESHREKLWQGAGTVKPALDRTKLPTSREWPDLRFNLSHTRGAVLIGAGLGFELGVDIERQRPMDDLDAMAQSVMSETELKQWLALDPASQLPAFYRLWTRKEAYLKAIGLGLFRSLQDVTVPVSSQPLDRTAGQVWLVEDASGQDVWCLADLPVAGGYAASICCHGARVPRLAIHDLQLEESTSGLNSIS